VVRAVKNGSSQWVGPLARDFGSGRASKTSPKMQSSFFDPSLFAHAKIGLGWPIRLWVGPLFLFNLIFVKKNSIFLKKLSTILKLINKKIFK